MEKVKVSSFVVIVFSFLFFLPTSLASSSGETILVDTTKQLEWIELEGSFNAVGVTADEEIQVLFQTDQSPEWNILHFHDDMKDGDEEISSDLFFLGSDLVSQKFRFKVILNNNNNTLLRFFFINTKNTAPVLASNTSLSPAYKRDNIFFRKVGVIPREIWGANESFRYKKDSNTPKTVSTSTPSQKVLGCQNLQSRYPDDFKVNEQVFSERGQKLRWSYRYSSQIKRIVVHHTAETNFIDKGLTAEEAMRSIYAYHANGRGWGDIGYHFVIAPDGKIMEGRAGGDFVVGGHSFCTNTSTIGVSLMGNFENGNPSLQQLESLQKLLESLSEKYGLDLQAESSFQGKFTPHLVGHRDYGQTACPGKNMYKLLPYLRDNIAVNPAFLLEDVIRVSSSGIKRTGELLGKLSIHQLLPGQKQTYTLRFKNTGNIAWDNNTWLYANMPKTDIGLISQENNPFMAAKIKEKKVEPGQSATFVFDLVGGLDGGLQTVEVTPVVNSRRLSSGSVVIPVKTQAANFSYSLQEKNISVSADKKEVDLTIKLKNTGNVIWTKQKYYFQVSVMGQRQYLIHMDKDFVEPGKIAVFKKKIVLPLHLNTRAFLQMQMWVDGNLRGSVIRHFLFKKNTDNPYSKNRPYQAFFMGSEKRRLLSEFTRGTYPKKYIIVQNQGSSDWKKDDIKLFIKGDGKPRILQMEEEIVKSGEKATFIFESTRKLVVRKNIILDLRYKNRKIKNGTIRWRIKGVKGFVSVLDKKKPEEKKLDIVQESEKKNTVLKGIDTEKIRIRLSYDKNTARVEGEFDILLDGKNIGSAQNVLVKKSGNKIVVNGESGNIIRLVPRQKSGILKISSWNNAPAWNKSLNDNLFRGILEFRNYNNKMITINELIMGDYLKGIAEVSNSAPKEKKRVIAVIARSYAAFYLSDKNRKYPGAPYDGDDSPASFQKYSGYGYEKRSPLFSLAVEDTQNIIVEYNGQLIKTPFFSESDGRTRSAKEVWKWNDTPYLQSVDDSFCKNGEGTLRGHGVGLSGCGAEQMARDGKSFREILKYYYKGVEVKSL